MNPKVRGLLEKVVVVGAAGFSAVTVWAEFVPRAPEAQSVELPDSVTIGGARVPIAGGSNGRVVIWMNYECGACHEFAVLLDSASIGPAGPIAYEMIPIARQNSRRGEELVATVLCANSSGVGELVHREFVALSLTERDTTVIPWARLAQRFPKVGWQAIRTCARQDSVRSIVRRQGDAAGKVGVLVTPAFVVRRALYSWWVSDPKSLRKLLQD
jgi:protein-disulfide isomerase